MDQEQDDQLTYLEMILDELHARGLAELVLMHHLVGGLSTQVDDYAWRACIDAALQAALRRASERP